MNGYRGLLLCAVTLLLHGCFATAIIGTGSAAGSAAFDKRSLGEHFDDIALSAKIKARLIAEKDLPSRWVSVEVLRGKVTLSGYLPRQDQIDRAIIISRSFKGVRGVKSEIRLGKPSAKSLVSDTWITARVKGKLLDDPITSGFSIHVETVDGMVYLRGFVDNDEQRFRARELALSVSGVADVKNELNISH